MFISTLIKFQKDYNSSNKINFERCVVQYTLLYNLSGYLLENLLERFSKIKYIKSIYRIMHFCKVGRRNNPNLYLAPLNITYYILNEANVVIFITVSCITNWRLYIIIGTIID